MNEFLIYSKRCMSFIQTQNFMQIKIDTQLIMSTINDIWVDRWSLKTLIASAINLIVHMQSHALPDYRRKITRIVEVRGVEHDRYVLQPLFAYDADQAELLPTRAFESWEEDAVRRITHP